MQGRLTNLKELPIHGYYLFEEPDLESDEAKEMEGMFDPQHRGNYFARHLFIRQLMVVSDNVLSAVHTRLSSLPTPWDAPTEARLGEILHEVRKEIKAPTRMFMKTLRWALTGLQDGPSIPDIIKVLGTERALQRLRVCIGEAKEDA